MRILFVTQSLGKGGAERLVLEAVKSLQQNHADLKIKIVPLSAKNSYPDLSTEVDIEFCNSSVQLSLTGKNKIDIAHFEKIVDDFKPDVIHSHTYKAELVSRENVRKGIKYFTHVHSDFPEFDNLSGSSFLSKKKLTRYFERLRIFKKYKSINNYFVAISHATYNHILGQLPDYFHQNIKLLPNAIDFKKFNGFKKPVLNRSELKLISVGRLFPHKNQIFLTSVVKLLADKNVPVKLQIAGIGPEAEKIKAKAIELGIEDKIEMLGLVDEIEKIYADSTIYVHPCLYEPFGLVLIEAMAAGLPVVCLDGGGNRDIIEQNKNGIMVFEQDAKVFAEAILQIADNQTLYNEMSAYAVEYASNFDIKPYADRLLELYRG